MLETPKKPNRNKKGLALSANAAKPGTLSGTSVDKLLNAAPPVPARPQPIQVAGSSRARLNKSGTLMLASERGELGDEYMESDGSSPLLPISAGRTPSLSGSSQTSTGSRSSYHDRLSEQIASLELGVEFKLDLRSEDLKVLCELGCGNGGTVSKCLHVPTKTVMAKKVVHIATTESTRKQILRELQIMHDCSSPYIVSFYGAYLQDPHICMCMEFMDVGSLDNIYKKVGPIPEPILAQIGFAVVSGLTYLYEAHKIMHRDVKPSNVLLNSAGQIKICDFGVSGELINSVADTFVGTSTYMSPERISGDPYTVKSDVWSLGITLVELALGRFPFSSDDDADSDENEDGNEHELIENLSMNGESKNGRLGNEDDVDDEGEDTLSPVRPSAKGQSLEEAERKRQAKREARLRKTHSLSSSSKKSKKMVAGVSLAGSGHQMSILELLQYIVNEPAPRLPSGKFSQECEAFVDATLRKEPVGWNFKKKGPLPKEIARPTPKELLNYDWIKLALAAETDLQAFVRSIP